MGLVEKVEKLIEVQEIREDIGKFCREQYKIKICSQKTIGWNRYEGFEIISKNLLRINYSYGYDDYEYNDDFTIDLIEFDRDSKIENIV